MNEEVRTFRGILNIINGQINHAAAPLHGERLPHKKTTEYLNPCRGDSGPEWQASHLWVELTAFSQGMITDLPHRIHLDGFRVHSRIDSL